MAFLNWLYVAVSVLLLFGASIFVHEFGHFWVARRRGLKVDGFSIGLGPKIFGWTRDGVDYAVRWIPAGGFVALPQMVTSETIEGKSKSSVPLPSVSPGSKILVALAGPIMNGIFAFVLASLIYLVGLPVLIDPPIIGEVEAGSAEAKAGLRPGDRILSVNGKAISSWAEAQNTAMLAPTNLMPVTLERDGRRFTANLEAKVSPVLGLKVLALEPKDHPVLREVRSNKPAERAGLKAGDTVLAFAGIPIAGQNQLTNLIHQRAGKLSEISVQRGDQKLQFAITPELDTGMIGVTLDSNGPTVYEVQRPGPLPWQLVGEICQQTFDTLGALVHSKRTGVHVSDLSGPAGILAALAIEVKADYRLALRFMVMLNISLAVLNLLPLPVLDGGHILLAVLEKLRADR